MLEEYLVQECDIVTLTRNRYGDFTVSSSVTESCRFRYIDTQRRTTHQEVNDSDAMIWLGPDTTAVKGSIILFENVYYKVERINTARRLGGTDIQFVKCDLTVNDTNIS